MEYTLTHAQHHKVQHNHVPARIILLKGLRLRTNVNITFSNVKQQPAHYKVANTAIAVYGNHDIVYIMFELHFEGNTKKVFQKLTAQEFRHFFEDSIENQVLPVRDEALMNERIERVVDFVLKNDKSVEDMESFVEDSFKILVCEQMKQMKRSNMWRSRPAFL